ncbi:MAG TPA: tetratricopeptide repeat protein [Candidatus Polarisedimenticolia bacterium]|nr:tetratricopeptide repeat protein [Candidatus Polarisedimenticolia bacterium]
MTSYCLILFALLLPMQRFLASVSGQILDHEGQPMAGAEVVYTNAGTLDRTANRVTEGTGKVYKIKTDKNGKFSLVGVEYGVYQIEITGADGGHVYSGRKHIGDIADTEVEAQNVLNVDLSSVITGPVEPGGGTNLASGKKTKEQQELIRQENAHAAKINRVMVQYHMAVAIEDWPKAIGLVQQLIALDANRWEFYQNLGTLQSNQTHYQEAAQSYAKGVEVAQKTLANASDTDRALTSIGDLLLAEADCYDRMEKVDEAVALYEKAAAVYPHPFMARYRACNALTNSGNYDTAIEKCNQASAEDPTQWGPYQVLGGVFTAANKPKDALEAYEKGIATAQQMLEAQPDSGRTKIALGQMLNSEGNLLVQLKKYDEAIAVFAQAAESAAYPAMPYFNLCATYYNLKRSQDAVAACDHAITSDPTLADAYYVKASILFGQGQLEHGKYTPPPGTTEALNKYLEYAPAGEHARNVREMIDQLSKEIAAPYKPAKK